ncbi:hypothetical protein BDU57DRAFT_430613, partial [Ampelomyces quisqualis]
VAVTVALATTTSAFTCTGNYFSFFNRPGSAMSYQRLDPALQPGTLSPHLHSFDGGDGLSASTDFAATQASSCTTARIKADKSLYWRPTLYWNGNGTGFHRVPEKSTKIYYKYGDGEKWANVTGFPEEFNMIAGSPNKRSDGENPGGVRWGCHQPDGRSDKIFTNGFPTGFQSCKYGFASEVTFPSCWNGKLLDPKNPNDHMAYPSGFGGVGVENCPTTHRAARFPTIFIEFWYDTSMFDGQYAANTSPWILSNGDPTGYSFHADFLNGWEKGVLEKATAQSGGCTCGCGCGQEEMEQCFGSANVNKDSDASWKSCGDMSTSESEGGEGLPVVENLPGCNPIQSGPADATPVTGAGCAATTLSSSGSGRDKSKASAPSAVNNDAKIDALPSLSLDPPNKGYGNDKKEPTRNSAAPVATASSQQNPAGSKDRAKPTPSTPKDNTLPAAPELTSVTGSDGEDCEAPVYFTVTPTIYVTAGSNSTSCGLGIVTKTMTQTATVTVQA